ncbi:MAG TPA: ScyD/ScyE family protein [Chitinophagaceae bacterium]|nr:ScyD/ScyE family protein [Chitinophagaceae bacterium]
MKRSNLLLMLVCALVLFVVSCQKEVSKNLQPVGEKKASALNYMDRAAALKKTSTLEPSAIGNISVYATGLYNPRGLKFGPDGMLYVAEGGPGGGTMSTGCAQVVFPVGPYLGMPTGGRVSKISGAGVRTTVTDRLPTSSANEIIGGDVEGVADVAFVGNTLYALLAGGGCSHGVPSVPNGIVKVNNDGSWNMVANLSAWQMAHPVAQPEEDDFEPDGTWYSMINVEGVLYALEPNHGELVKVTTAGNISRVADISATQGHIVPTVLAYRGNFFVGNLHPFPNPGGASKIYKVNPAGQVKIWAEDLNMVLGLVIDETSRMYVLEMAVGSPFPEPGLGRVIRIDPGGSRTVIATGLSLPTGMTMGPDGNLYVSNWGFGPPALGGGQVLKIELPH